MNIKSTLRARYRKENHRPSVLGIFINPYYIIRRGLYREIAAHRHALSGRLLDFGCGRKPYRTLFEVTEYIGLDIEASGHDHKDEEIDVYYDGRTIPFEDEAFDAVFSSEVLEHVFNLDEVLAEISRVTKLGGHLLISVPFVWNEHEVPYDFGRYTSFGIAHAVRKAGFDIVEARKTTTCVETIFQMICAYVSQRLLPTNQYANALLTPVFVAPITIVGLALSALLPKDDTFFHNNVVLARRRARRDGPGAPHTPVAAPVVSTPLR